MISYYQINLTIYFDYVDQIEEERKKEKKRKSNIKRKENK